MIRQFARFFIPLTALLLPLQSNFFAASQTTPDEASETLGLQTIEIQGTDGQSLHAIVVPRESNDIKVVTDGVIDEPVWGRTQVHDEFYVTDPDTLEPASLRSEWRLFYTDRGLYVSAICEQDPDSLVERLSARDQGFLNRDYVSFTLDTSGEGRYGYWFQLNLGGSRSDGTIQPERRFSDSWDGAWYGETARTATGWSAEFFVPWSIVSMPRIDGDRQMGIVMQRRVAHSDVRYAYPPLPFTKPKYLSAFQKLVLRDVQPRQQLSFFPQVSSTYDSMAGNTTGHAGLDMFWRPSTNFQLTATAKPDFGTVEADSVIINLSAIETFFPEKRLFFLEGQEIFVPTSLSGGWGGGKMMLLHTRRIGQRPFTPALPVDASFEYEQFRRPTDLLGAAKATGSVGNLRYGALVAMEDNTMFRGTLDGEPIGVEQAGRDFGVVRALWEKSNGNYKGLGFMSTQMDHPSITASTHGIDAHFFSTDGKVRLESQLLMSDIQGSENGYGAYVNVDYSQSQGVTHEFSWESYDDKLNLNYLGYLPRNDVNMFEYEFQVRKYSERFKEVDTEFSIDHSMNGVNQVIYSSIRLSRDLTFNNNTRFRIRGRYRPDQFDDRNSFGNGTFLEESTSEIDLRYMSDSSRRFFYSVDTSVETGSIDGKRLMAGSFMIWRPSDRVTMNAAVFYSYRDSWLLYQGDRRFTAFQSESWSPRVGADLFLSAKQHLRLDLQWTAIKARERLFRELPYDDTKLVAVDDPDLFSKDDFAYSRMNVQVRYRWELAPMSDLYVVYAKRAALPGAIGYGFVDQFSRTFNHPTSEGLVLKLRHHLGS